MPDFAGLRKSERDFFGQYVTGERQKWRDHIRDQAAAIQLIVESIVDTPESKKAAAASLRKCRTSIAVRLNPGDADDNNLLRVLDDLIGKSKAIAPGELEHDSRKVIEEISWLLKHDWNRVKSEAHPIWYFWKSVEKVDRRNKRIVETSIFCDATGGLISLTAAFMLAVALFAGLKWEWKWLSPTETGFKSNDVVIPIVQHSKSEINGSPTGTPDIAKNRDDVVCPHSKVSVPQAHP